MITAPKTLALRRLQALYLDLSARVAAVEARLPDPMRDVFDQTLLDVIADSTHALPFRTKDLLLHRHVDAALDAAIANATIQTVDELGAWLRGRRGRHGGITVERIKRRWRVTRDARHVQTSNRR